MKPLPFSPQLAYELHEEPARSISQGVKSFISVVHNTAKTAAQLETGPHPGAAGSNPRSQLSFLSYSPTHTHTPPAPNTPIPFFTLQCRMSIMVRGKLGSFPPGSDSWHALWPPHFPGSSSPSSKRFLCMDRIKWFCGAMQPVGPSKQFPLHYQGTPPSPSALTDSKHWQKTPPSPGIRPFAQYQPMTQPWAENPEMEALCFISKI